MAEFNRVTVPKLPYGFVDRSYHNDVSPHYEKEWGEYRIDIWINYDDPEEREVPEQYSVCIAKGHESEYEEEVMFSIEDFSEAAMKEVAKRIFTEVFRLMRKYR